MSLSIVTPSNDIVKQHLDSLRQEHKQNEEEEKRRIEEATLRRAEEDRRKADEFQKLLTNSMIDWEAMMLLAIENTTDNVLKGYYRNYKNENGKINDFKNISVINQDLFNHVMFNNHISINDLPNNNWNNYLSIKEIKELQDYYSNTQKKSIYRPNMKAEEVILTTPIDVERVKYCVQYLRDYIKRLKELILQEDEEIRVAKEAKKLAQQQADIIENIKKSNESVYSFIKSGAIWTDAWKNGTMRLNSKGNPIIHHNFVEMTLETKYIGVDYVVQTCEGWFHRRLNYNNESNRIERMSYPGDGSRPHTFGPYIRDKHLRDKVCANWEGQFETGKLPFCTKCPVCKEPTSLKYVKVKIGSDNQQVESEKFSAVFCDKHYNYDMETGIHKLNGKPWDPTDPDGKKAEIRNTEESIRLAKEQIANLQNKLNQLK